MLSSTGGGSATASDRVTEMGLALAPISDATRAELETMLLPPQAANPVDLGGRKVPQNVEIAADATRILFADDSVDYGLAFLMSMAGRRSGTASRGSRSQSPDRAEHRRRRCCSGCARNTRGSQMRFASLAAGAAFATLIYRGKPVRIVNPFAAGGNTDLVTRALTERAAPLMKQSFIIENRPGAMTKVWTQSAVPPNPSGRSCASHLRPFAPLHAVPP